MEAQEQIQHFEDFFKQHYYDEILSAANREDKVLAVPFLDLSKFNVDLANDLLDDPENTLKAAQLSISNLDLGTNLPVKDFTVRFHDLPDHSIVRIKDVRSKHLHRFILARGVIRQKTPVRPQVTTAKFECPSCGAIHNILQVDTKFREPVTCSCGRKGGFRLLSKELIDVQKISLEESSDELEGSDQPKRIDLILRKDLVSPLAEKMTNPGSKIAVTGILKEIPILLSQGGRSTRYDLMLEANHVMPIEQDFSELIISKEEEREIKNLSKDPEIFPKLIASLAPHIYGHDQIKRALTLQLFGGVLKEGGVRRRGDIHILLVGDPGAAKSQLLKRVISIAPKGRFVSGKGSSGTGLTAALVKDEFLRGWALEAGDLVLANKGIIAIDEMDKMSQDDTSALHEGMEQQTITVSKGNIHATLRSETTILAAANPKFGRFDPYELIAKQIELPSTLINRFDLIFPVRDLPDRERDTQLATFILSIHKGDENEKPYQPLSDDIIRKYVAYAKQHVKPALTTPALEEIKRYFVEMRNYGGDGTDSIKSIPISARQLEGLIRLAEASARTRLSKTVTKDDAKIAIDLTHYCLQQIGVDPKTGKFDIDRITTTITASTRSGIHLVKEIISNLEEALGVKQIPLDDVIRECELKGVSAEDAREVIEKLKRSGDLYSPKPDTLSKI
ncbi:MAG: minichromosome maintenance protein MCM [Candidatus Woesearchaeota archaeon]|nr:MAG: minichromosome maintenance protein MCM [Candidatus Woesearchaeota archaeon]